MHGPPRTDRLALADAEKCSLREASRLRDVISRHSERSEASPFCLASGASKLSFVGGGFSRHTAQQQNPGL